MDINNYAILIISSYFVIITTNCPSIQATTTIRSTGSQGQSQNSGSVNTDNSNTVSSIYNPSDAGSCNYDFTGPADDIFIIDRSESVNQGNFHRAKVFIKDLIQSSFVLRDTDNRIAVITYTSEPTQKLNFLHVTSPNEVVSECELFLPGGLWDNVLFDNVMKNGANLQGAFDLAKDIFRRTPTERSSVTKRLWILTDFENTQVTVSPSQDFPEVKFYGVGVGNYNREKEDQSFYEVITEEPGCRYRKINDWEEAMKTFARVTLKQGFNLGPDMAVSDVTLCQDMKNCSDQCTCKEFDHQTTSLKCTPKTDSVETAISDDNWMIIRIVFGTVFGIIFIVIVVLFIWCCCKLRNKKQPEKFHTLPTLTRSEGTTTDTLSTTVTDASTYTNTSILESGQYPTLQPQVNGLPNPRVGTDENVYENGDLADILKAHGIVQDGTNPRNNVAENNNRTRSEIKGKGKYKKNNKLCETVSAPANIEPGRQISVISTATSNHSYIEPIHTPQPLDPKHPYSYAYMDSMGNRHQVHATNGNGLKSPASSHSYEKFNFNPDQQHKPGSNDFNSELTSKLQRMRNRISGAFSRKGKKQSNINYTANLPSKVSDSTNNLKFPQRIPNTPLYQESKETQPVYIDPNTGSNTLPPEDNAPGDRSSTKLGTMKFKNLLYKFSGSDQDIVANRAVHQYEPGPNGPYSLVHGDTRNNEKPPSFKEIL